VHPNSPPRIGMHENPTCLRQAYTMPMSFPTVRRVPKVRNMAAAIVSARTVLRTCKLREVAVLPNEWRCYANTGHSVSSSKLAAAHPLPPSAFLVS
jgi:hypothetical protein